MSSKASRHPSVSTSVRTEVERRRRWSRKNGEKHDKARHVPGRQMANVSAISSMASQSIRPARRTSVSAQPFVVVRRRCVYRKQLDLETLVAWTELSAWGARVTRPFPQVGHMSRPSLLSSVN
jgi:hypothetical protein